MMRFLRFYLLLRALFLPSLAITPSLSLAEEGKWTKKADMPTPRSDFSTSVVKGRIYAIGGYK